MQDDFEDDYETMGQSVLAVDVDEIAVPIPLRELQPWHRPRKQYVRERQWKACAANLVDRLLSQKAASIQDGNIKYLTLPGIDYFDVEVISEVTKAKGLQLEATGFLSAAERGPIRARSEVRADSLIKNGVMTDTSNTFAYNFEQIASPNGQPYREIRDRAPFHIVNIDACGSIAPPKAQQPSRIINALFSLIELQFQRMVDPWCLFLTTDARHDNVSSEVLGAMSEAIRQNAAESEDFRDGAINLLGSECDDLEQALENSNADPKRFLNKFSLGLAKWLLHHANAQGWDMSTKTFFCYSTGLSGEEEDSGQEDCDNAPKSYASMPCVAFEFRKQPAKASDLFGAVQNPLPKSTSDVDYSQMALERVQQMKDLDELMQASKEHRQEFAIKQRQLLVGAGYTTEALTAFDNQFMEAE